ncbi:MAG TPA: beta-1,6-N-acetylglucosaminyltransferase [Acidimicrobiales bacterium]
MTDGRHSFLILAHHDAPMLRRLVNRVAPLGPIYIHVDAKTDFSQWKCEDLPVTFLPRRVPVYWGDWSILEATTRLLECALADPANTRFTLLSGVDYPIISNDEIEKRARGDRNVIASRHAPNMADGSRPEIEYQRRFYRTNKSNGAWSAVKNGVMNRIVYYGRPLDWKSVTPETGMRAGQQFWSINREFAEYCVAQIRSSRPLIEFFKNIVCSDEKVFQTLYGEYSREISQDGTTFTKWAGGPHPVPFSRDEITSALTKNHFWFARKFSSSDAATLDWLDTL